jgi:hypothetical protein
VNFTVQPFVNPRTGTNSPNCKLSAGIHSLDCVQPQRRADNRELFYLGLNGTMMSTSVDVRRGFAPGAPEGLFPTGLQRNPGTGQYAVTPDGQRFLLRTDVADDRLQRFTIVLNWQRAAKY